MADTSDTTLDDHQHSLGHYMTLGLLETLVNGMIGLDAPSLEALAAFAGTVIKLKIREPYQVIYLILDSDGIEIRDEYPGHADIRINCTLYALGRRAMGLSHPPGQWKIWGQDDKIRALSEIARHYDLRTATRQWLRQHLNLGEILQKIRNRDSSWLQDLTPLPALLRDTLQQMRQINGHLDRQQSLLAEQMLSLRRERRDDALIMALMIVLVSMSTLPTKLSMHDLFRLPLLLLLFYLVLRRRHA